nr:site-specific integrase [uncultured Marinobacter sp.]
MKNFILVEAPSSRRERHLLLHLSPNIDDNNRELASFSHYSRWLARHGYAESTILKYSENVANFLDFLFEASKSQSLITEKMDFEDVTYSYESFMLFGRESENPLAKELAEKLNKENKTSPTSLAQNIQASIYWYIKISLLDLASQGKFDPFFEFFFQRKVTHRSNAEKAKIKQKSWLAGTIRNSLNRLATTGRHESLFPGVTRRQNKKGSRKFKVDPFPIESSVRLVRSKKPKKSSYYHRDMALYSLLSATGGRTHEALQLRFKDIKTGGDGYTRIEFHSPFERENPGLTPKENHKLAWKGRETEKTFMIEPFASIFWEHLQSYLKLEYNSSVNHDFVFQKRGGRPFFSSDRKNRNETFRAYAVKAGVKIEKRLGMHSLRHMYGTYVLNYMPVPGNRMPGLPLAYVQKLLGHASATSTQRYARHDDDILDAFIEHANKFVTGKGEDSLASTRLEFHKRQIEMLENEFGGAA